MIKNLLQIPRSLLHRQFVQNVLTLQIGSIVEMGIGFIKSILFARLLGLEGFGMYAVVLAMTGTFGIFTNLGQNQAALTFFAETYGKKDKKEMLTVMKYFLQLFICAGIILILFAILAPVIAEKLYNSSDISSAARIAFLAMFFGSTHALFRIFLQVTRQIIYMTALENLSLFFQLVFPVTLLWLGYGIQGIFTGILMSHILMFVVYMHSYYITRKHFPIPSLRAAATHKKNTLAYIKQGAWIAIDKNIGNLFPQGFFFVMSIVASPSIIGLAQLSFKIASIPRMFLLPHAVRMATTILPKVYAESSNQLRKTCAQLIKHTVFFHALISFGGLIVLPPLALNFYGLEFSAMIPTLMWIILIQIISGLNVANSPLFRMFKKTHIPALWGMVSLPLQLLAFIALLMFLPALQAFTLGILIMYVTNLYLNWYLYTYVLRKL